MTINNQQGPGYFQVGNLFFSPDSQRLSYMIKKGDLFHIVVDGKLGEGYPNARLPRPMYSPDSKHVAYEVGKDNKAWVVFDGKADKQYDFVVGSQFSPNSQRFAYAAMVGKNWHAVVDRAEDPAFKTIGRQAILFSPDSKRVGFVGYQTTKVFAVIDGVPSDPFERVEDITFSPNGQHVAFRAQRGGKWFLILNGQTHTAADAIGDFAFNTSDQSLAYAASREGKWFVTMGGREHQTYSEIKSLSFASADHSKGSTDNPTGVQASRWSYMGKRNGVWQVVVDHLSSQRYEHVLNDEVLFSPDGRHTAFIANREGEIIIVVDGVEDQPIGKLVRGSKLHLDNPKRLSAMVVQDDQFMRLEIHIDD